MLIYFVSAFLAFLGFSVLFFVGLPQLMSPSTVPATIMLVSHACFACGQYRFGPNFAAYTVGRITGGVFVLAVNVWCVMCYLGPPSYVPFNSKTITTGLLLPPVFFILLSGEDGASPAKGS